MRKIGMFLLAGIFSCSAMAQDGEEAEGLFGLGLPLYLGASYADGKLSVSESDVFPDEDFDTEFYVAHIGTRYKAFAFELQAGFGKDQEDEPASVETDSYYGAFVIPTGTVLNKFELAFPIGVTHMTLEQGGLEDDFEGVAYGANIQFPLKLMSEALPDIRIIGGGMVYQQDTDTRVYGWNAGLRYDFKI